MLCPHCKAELRMTERRNIEIDYCPQCRGVWLDRGELDKLLESSERGYGSSEKGEERRRYPEAERYDGDRKPYYKKKSFLSELFDF